MSSPIFRVIALCAFGASHIIAGAEPPRITDLTCVTTGENVLLYAADDQGDVYSIRPADTDGGVVPLTELTKVWQSSECMPVAITVARGKLIIADSASRKLIEFDPLTNTSRTLVTDLPISGANGVAPLNDGSFVITDKASKMLIVLRRSDEGLLLDKPKQLPFAPGAVVATSSGLIVLDIESGNAVRVRVPRTSNDAEVDGVPVGLPESERLTALSTYNGIVYGSSPTACVAFAAVGSSPAVLLPATSITPTTTPIAASARSLYALDDSAHVIRTVNRIVPIRVVFDRQTGKNLFSLIALYQLLDAGERLPMRRLVAKRSYASLEDLLYDEHVLIPANAVHVNRESLKDAGTHTLVDLICKWNAKLCTDGNAATILSAPVPIGADLWFPALPVDRDVTLSKVALDGIPVSSHLRQRLSSPDERAKWNAARLSALNGRLASTAEGVFAEMGYVVATPPLQGLGPGQAFRTEGGRDRIDVGCVAEGEREVLSIGLPLTMGTLAAEQLIPRDGPGQLPSFAAAGIQRVEIRYENAVRERLADPSQLTNRCISGSVKAGYVVRESLRADRLLVRFYDQSSAPLMPTQKQLEKLHVHGKPDPDHVWSTIIDDGPYYVAYKANEWDAESGSAVGDVAVLKPGTAQDILSLSVGELLLPVEYWSIVITAPRSDLKDRGSALGSFASVDHPVSFFPQDSATAVGMTVADTPNLATSDRPELETREQLRNDINFHSEAGFLERVAVAENIASVDFTHPDFFNGDGESIWFDASDLGEPVRRSDRQRSRPTRAAIRNSLRPEEHGTHIAGLLAAQRSSQTPGLIPDATLVLVDTTSPDTTQNTLRNAALAVHIFCMSFDWTDKDAATDFREIVDTLKQVCADCLLVIAAGDDGRPVMRNGKAYPPIGWLPELTQHAIGVGALDGAKLLGRYDVTPVVFQTNWGNQYVQILAPGRNILSTAPDAAYAVGSGTSQAVPQVVAAAAMLWQMGITQPSRVKARLMYTTNLPPPDEAGALRPSWGGRLNVDRALWQLDQNILYSPRFGLHGASLRLAGNPEIIFVGGTDVCPYDENLPPQAAGLRIRLDRVLRLTTDNGTFRLIYRDDGRVPQIHIVTGIQKIRDTRNMPAVLPCDALLSWDDDRNMYGNANNVASAGDQCRTPSLLKWDDVTDYVGSIHLIPAEVKFRPEVDAISAYK